ncbi:group XIIB secretory phospholipase A2-like protein [Palaemon carinicauda]|uniref:group XIIB secretory phospholipase A2-like protein n=1 Tax=Palaemon carinicauda TaxID=392227 RepID=UPI0035B58E56
MKFYILLTLFLTSSQAFGESYFETLYQSMAQAQETLKEVAVNVNNGLKILTRTMKFVENFVDSTVEEDCVYSCRSNKIPIPNPKHVPDFNGCGSLGVFFDKEDLSRPEMEGCCNEHDLCYDTCGSDKEVCDRKFKSCLYNTCKENEKDMDMFSSKTCKGGAKLLYTATMALGCASYKDAQSNACICVDTKDAFRQKNEL